MEKLQLIGRKTSSDPVDVLVRGGMQREFRTGFGDPFANAQNAKLHPGQDRGCLLRLPGITQYKSAGRYLNSFYLYGWMEIDRQHSSIGGRIVIHHPSRLAELEHFRFVGKLRDLLYPQL